MLNQNIPTDNMFTTSREEDKKYEVFPEASMKSGPIYRTAEEYEVGPYRFVPRTGQMLHQLLQTCRDLQQNQQVNLQPLQSTLTEQYGIAHCPDNPSQIIQECGDNIPCLYDYTMLNARVLGLEALNTWNAFTLERLEATRQCSFSSVFLSYFSQNLFYKTSLVGECIFWIRIWPVNTLTYLSIINVVKDF
uniref:DUF7658 domain-containing protein n=1 Tax=Parascaris equorum TaxID=6256 RepID=A0A914RB15_PAREQ